MDKSRLLKHYEIKNYLNKYPNEEKAIEEICKNKELPEETVRNRIRIFKLVKKETSEVKDENV